GWWKIATQPSNATGNWVWPLPLQGNGGNRDVLLFHEGTNELSVVRLQHRSATVHAFPTSASFTTSLIDAAERDKDKAWRKVGAIFANPDLNGNTASTDAVTVYLDASYDGGATWAVHALQTITGNTLGNQTFTLNRVLPTPVTSRFVML